MDWRIKGAIQKVLGVLPRGEQAHYWLQKRAGGLRKFDAECDAKLEDLRLMLGHLRASGIAIAGTRYLEVGTGWYPTFPYCLYLLGAKRVETFDLNRYLKPPLVRSMVERVRGKLAMLAEAGERDLAEVTERYGRLARHVAAGASLEDATEGVVQYHAPADASRTGLGKDAVDVVFSNSVLEHVPGPVIEDMFEESLRILPPGGVMFHSVNCGDHYAYADRKISQLHYLQFSEERWAFWNNAFLYQNRLRASDFTKMARDAGFAVEIDTSRPHPERLRQLDEITVHPSFARYPREQLAITSIDFVARRPRPASA
ncbi:MAG: class I SAM-dependent methyltransferase [Kofleriaceae bacterium]